MNDGFLEITENKIMVVTFGLERHGKVHGYRVGVTLTNLRVRKHHQLLFMNLNLNSKRQAKNYKNLKGDMKNLMPR